MTENRRHGSHDCPPAPGTPADQPKPPSNSKCDPLPTTTPPDRPKAPECMKVCKCPSDPSTDPNCLEKLIAEKTAGVPAAEKAKKFAEELGTVLTAAKAAAAAYNLEKYDLLLKQWVEQDEQIAELIRKLVCAVPCWRCVIECYVCPAIDQLRTAEYLLYGGDTYDKANNLIDMLNWHTRDRDTKARLVARVKAVIDAWKDPSVTLGGQTGHLNVIKGLIADANQKLGTESTKVVFDVFMKIVPLHLAIAPPANSGYTTRIAKEYTEFCKCDDFDVVDCCGPNLGDWTIREQLVGAQPYLIEPKALYDLLCCLVKNFYGPAQEALAAAELEVAKYTDEIKRNRDLIATRVSMLAVVDATRLSIPGVIDCSKYTREETSNA